MSQRNRIPLYTKLDGRLVSHFSLHEFESSEGYCMVHPALLEALERTRAALCERYGGEVVLIITSALRTPEENKALAKRLGWADQGGAVARKSKHLPEFHGVATDLKARVKRTSKLVPQKVLVNICRQYFDYVKDDYKDGHVHADKRNAT